MKFDETRNLPAHNQGIACSSPVGPTGNIAATVSLIG